MGYHQSHHRHQLQHKPCPSTIWHLLPSSHNHCCRQNTTNLTGHSRNCTERARAEHLSRAYILFKVFIYYSNESTIASSKITWRRGFPLLAMSQLLLIAPKRQWQQLSLLACKMTRVVSTPPHFFSTFFGATGWFQHYPTCSNLFQHDRGGFNTTQTVFDVFRHDRGGFNTTPPVFNWFRRDRGGFNTTPLFSTGFDVIGVVSTPAHSFRRVSTQPGWFQHHPTPVQRVGRAHPPSSSY